MARHSRPAVKIMESSLFLMASTGLTAGLGYCFWILVDHRYSPQRVGLATSLVNTISLISYLALFGFNSVLIRHQAKGPARNRQVTLGLLATGAGAGVFGALFLALMPWVSPKLLFIREDAWYAVFFVVFCVFAGVNLLTDSVFMAARLPQYNLLVDGVVQSLTKLAMPIFLVTFGAVGIVASSGIGFAVAVLVSLAAMVWRLGFRFDPRPGGTRLREQARYSAASYGSSLLNLLPQLVLPLIALQKLGGEAEAYYFMALQVANIAYTASHSIGDATFAEASHDVSRLRECLKRSAKLNVVILIPAVTVLSLGAGLVLSLFGQAYAQNAKGLLVLLAVGALAVALNNWSGNALRVIGRMRAFVISNVFFAAVSIGMAAAFASRGLLWVGGAWVAGNFVSGLVGLVYIPWRSAELAERPAAPQAVPGPAAEPGPDRELEPFGRVDDTVPLVFPWVTAEIRRVRSAKSPPGARAPESHPVHGFGGDMAVRTYAAAPAADDEPGRVW